MTDSKPGKHALSFILVTLLLNSIGFGIVIPVTPALIVELTSEGIDNAAIYGGLLMFVYALTQFLGAPLLGNLSDRFGRRPVLLISLFVLGIDYLIMSVAPTLFWLFVGRFLAGFAGATSATANAYIADITPPEERAQKFGLIGAAFGVGFIIGPVIGGVLGEYGTRVPFYAAAGLAFLNMLYGLFVLPETLTAEHRRSFSLKLANPIGAVMQMRQYPVVFGLFGVIMLHQIAHDANPAIWTYYTIERFSWSALEVGYSMGFVGVMMVIVQAGLIKPTIQRFGEQRTIYIGFSMMAIGFAGFAFATQGWMMYLFIVPFALGSIAMPALRGIMANQTPDDAQGALQGAISSLIGLTMIFSPVFMTQIFGYFSGDAAPLYFPGAAFFVAAMMLLGAILVFSRADHRG